MFNSFPQPRPDSGVGGPSMLDWSAYDSVYDWSQTGVNVPTVSWNTFVDTTGAGWLTFLRAYSNMQQAEMPDVRVTVDGTIYTFLGVVGAASFFFGNLITMPIYFSKSLKIEVYNRHTAAVNLHCDFTYLSKAAAAKAGKQTLLTSSARNSAFNMTSGTTIADIVNINGSGYLLGIEFSASNNAITGLSTLTGTVIVDGITKMNGALVNRPGDGSTRNQFYGGPIRFNNALRVRHQSGHANIFGLSRVFYTLD